jgi:hypothetical protein
MDVDDDHKQLQPRTTRSDAADVAVAPEAMQAEVADNAEGADEQVYTVERILKHRGAGARTS